MPILTGDLKILAAESLDDSPNGGGGLTERSIVDGQSNNIFKDISHLKRTYGGVNMAKVFAAVRTQTNEPLLGAFIYLDKIPADKKLSVNLFSTNEAYDLRSDAAARVENYRAQGGKYLGFLYGTQYQGSQVITIFQLENAPIPANGDVLLLLRIAPEKQQFIRVTGVSSTVQTFTDLQASYKRRVVTLTIASPLLYDFPGVDISRVDNISAPSVIYTTTVANAARYYSSRPLKVAAALGDYKLKVDSLYSQVVPSSQSDTPLVDQTAAGNTSPLILAADGIISVAINYAIQANINVYLGRPCYPNTLAISYGVGTLTDSGGQIYSGSTAIGTIDYAHGLISFAANAPVIVNATASFKPAGVPITVADTDIIAVTDASRSSVYTFNITPPPQPNALSVSYMAMGQWYEFRDNGAGALIPLTEGTGAGSINYLTGSGTLTCASLPDIGSGIILSWGKKSDYTHRAGAAIRCGITKQLAHDYIKADTFTITWTDSQNTTLTILSNAAGVLSGAGTGQVNATTGMVVFYPNTLPAKGTSFRFDYQWIDGALNTVRVSKTIGQFDINGHIATFDLQDTNLIPGSLSISWITGWGSTIPQPVPPLGVGEYLELPKIASGTINKLELDNGLGGLISGRNCAINYATGIVSLDWYVGVPLKFPLLKTRMPLTILGA